MNKIIILPLFCSLLFANEMELLQKDKKELRQIEKEVIQKKYEGAKDDWIGTINLSSGLNRSHAFSKESDTIIQEYHSKEYLTKLLKECGFEIQEIRDFFLHTDEIADKLIFICKKIA